MRKLSILVLMIASSLAIAAPPEVPKQVITSVGKSKVITVKTDGGKAFSFASGFDPEKCTLVRLFSEDPNIAQFLVIPQEDGQFYVTFWTRGDKEAGYSQTVITVTSPDPKPPVPPTPPGPNPPGPTPPPGPVTSFHVFFVYESHDLLTSSQKSVTDGKAVEEYLNSTCTGGKSGWRRRDKNSAGEFDPTMKEFWASIQPEFLPPNNTKLPAVAIEVNKKVEIIALPNTPQEMIATFKRYNGGK